MKNLGAVIMAGGYGKRMNSVSPKVLRELAGRPIISYTLKTISDLMIKDIVVVVGYMADEVKKTVGDKVIYAHQDEPLGTAHAMQVALKKMPKNIETILSVYGDDSAFYKPTTLQDYLDFFFYSQADMACLTLQKEDPTGLGRILRGDSDRIIGIVEEKLATDEEKSIKEVNTGAYIFNRKALETLLPRVERNLTGEYFLTDTVSLAIKKGYKVVAYRLKDPSEWIGINTLEQLEFADSEMLKMKNIHFMGILGSGASAAASIASSFGYKVSGCDLNLNSEYLSCLPKEIKVYGQHTSNHLRDIDLLVISPAITSLDSNNPEVLEAEQLKIPLMTWPEFVGKYLLKNKLVLAVSGTHGKSTTTALLGLMLESAGLDPTVVVGAMVPEWQANYRYGKSGFFVIEADEYNNSFHNYHPNIVILTSLEYDHPEYFASFEEVEQGFMQFITQNIKDNRILILNSQDSGSRKLLNGLRTSKYPHLEIIDINPSDYMSIISYLNIPGDFNYSNAALAAAAASLLGVRDNEVSSITKAFRGIGRRLELVGEPQGVKVYDDYAHHPTAVYKTIQAIWQKYKESKLWIIYQPHMFTRTKVLFNDFVKTFRDAPYDHAIILDIYAAREKNPDNISSRVLADATHDKRVQYIGDLSQAAKYVASQVTSGDIVVCMGAGDITKVSKNIITQLSNG